MNLNKAFILGRMTQAPEAKALPNGTPVTSFSVATNSNYKGKDGVQHEKTEFHFVIVFGNMAENCARWLEKGQEVFVEGKITTRSWDKPDGTKAYKTEIIAGSVQFGAKSGQKGTRTEPEPVIDVDSGEQRKIQPEAKTATKKTIEKGYEYPDDDINPEDIPF